MGRELEFLIYRAADEDISVNAVIKDETIWLPRSAMAELFFSLCKHWCNLTVAYRVSMFA